MNSQFSPILKFSPFDLLSGEKHIQNLIFEFETLSG